MKGTIGQIIRRDVPISENSLTTITMTQDTKKVDDI